jgi:hypothetical protein
MRMPHPRFRVRWMMIAVGLIAISLWVGVRLWPTNRVLAVARASVPGIIEQSIRAETFNDASAWEVHGTDPEGTVWMLDISAWGEVLMKEPIAYGPPRSVVVPEGL